MSSETMAPAPAAIPDFFAGGGEMGRLLALTDWSRTPLGPASSWSPSLKMMVRLLLTNRFPMNLLWGPKLCQIYNDPYRPILGNKHPESIGQPASECWAEIWHIIGPLLETPLNGGPSTWMEDIFLEMNRYGFVEETHFTIAYSPAPDESVPSGIGGVLATVHEITEKVVAERRMALLRDLGAQTTGAETAEAACALTAEILARHPKDISFALLYLIDSGRDRVVLAGSAGVAIDGPASPGVIALGEQAGGVQPWPVDEVLRAGTSQTVEDLAVRFRGAAPPGPWSDPPRQAVVAPIHSNVGRQLAGLVIAGVSSRLRLDGSYISFIELAASQIGIAIANARAYEEERKRAEALAEIDRAKTMFFSNVSHEFRTPLTLMLGPLEEALSLNGSLPEAVAEKLAIAHRNGLRLQKLVNTLLDFSRIEAGRMQASYEPTDLAKLTEDLASNFRSAIEKAGLRFTVACPALPEPLYVDREMWEKVVLNLLSNAFKHTFEGEIAVRLTWRGDGVDLIVSDTGIGIAPADLPHIFERFHRIRGARARTHEGTGIGLALVQELVKLQGGTVLVESKPDRGTAFTISMPRGSAHLPADHLGSERELGSTATGADVFRQEALRWLPAGGTDSRPGAGEAVRARVLLADDNADMREYVQHLLSERFDVEAAANGKAALDAMRRRRPDLVLSDVMMPELDGFGLLAHVRADPKLQEIPFIMLSARAGEEARIEGFRAGADDYLVKPFSARELMARVSTHVEMARFRRESAEVLRRSEARLANEAEALARLNEATSRLWRVRSLSEGLDEMLAATMDLLGADMGCVQIFDAERGVLAMAAHRGFGPDFVDFFKEVSAEEDSACGRALLARERIVIEDVEADAAFAPLRAIARAADYRAVQSTPLIGRDGALLGVLSTHFRPVHRPVDHELHWLDLYVRHATDFIERCRGEEALRHRTEQYETLLHRAPLGVFMVDSDFRIREINPVALPVFGAIPGGVAGRDFEEIIHILWEKAYADEIVRLFRHTLKTGESFFTPERAEFRIDRGLIEYYEWRLDRITLPEGRYGVVCYFRDISQQVQAREVIADSERRYRQLMESVPVALYTTDAEGRITLYNAAAAALWGREPAIGEDLWCGSWRIYRPDGSPLPLNECPMAVTLRQRRAVRGEEIVIERPDGVRCNVLPFPEPLTDASGQLLGAVNMLVDITDRKQAEEALRESEERFRAIFEGARVSIWEEDYRAVKAEIDRLAAEGVTDLRHYCIEHPEFVYHTIELVRIIDVNQSTLRLFGATAKEELLQSLQRVFLPETVPTFIEGLAAIAGKKQFFESETSVQTLSGECLAVLFTITFPPDGESFDRVLVTLADITARKRMEDTLRRNNERQRILSEALAHLLSADSPDRIVRDLFSRVAAHLGMEIYFNYLVNENGDGLILHSCGGIPDDAAREIHRLAFGQGLCGAVAQTRQPIVATDIQDSSDSQTSLAKLLGIQTYAGNPLMSGDRLLGTLSFASRTRMEFDAGELAFLRVISDYVALGMERGRSLQVLRDSEQRLRLALEAGRMGTWEWNVATNEVTWSPGLEAIHGLGPGTFSRTFEAYQSDMHPEDRERVLQSVTQCVEGGEDHHIEYRIIRPDGSLRWVEGSGKLFRDPAGAPSRMIGVCMDITGRKLAEETLRQSEEELRILHGVAATLSSEMEVKKLIQAVTDAGRELSEAGFGAFFHNAVDAEGERYTLSTLSGAPPEAFEQFGMPRNTCLFAPTFSGEYTVRIDDVLKDSRYGQSAPHYGMPPGHLPVRSYLAVAVKSRAGKVLGGLFYGHPQTGVFSERAQRLVEGIAQQAAIAIDNAQLYENARQELDQRRRVEAALRRSNEELRRANTDLEQFAYSASHDLQEPIRNVSIYGEVLGRRYAQALDPRGKEYLAFITMGAKRLDMLVKDLLAYTQSGNTDREATEEIDATTALAKAVSNLSASVGENDAEISHDSLPSLRAHEVQLQQLFQNLIGNAIKYRSDGERPRIHVSAARDGDHWRFSVRDNGIGIPPEYQDRVFGIFKRLHGNEKYSGTGIGLAICLRIVQRNGGRIWVESEGMGKGSTFHFTLLAGSPQ